MNIRKRIKAEQKHIDEEILKEGQPLYDRLTAQYCVPSAAAIAKKKKKVIISLSCVMALILTAGIVMFFTLPRHAEYLRENFMTEQMQLSDFNAVDKRISVITDKYNASDVKRIYDKVSSDTLYYETKLQEIEGFTSGKLFLCTNKRFNFPTKFSETIKTIKFNGLTVNYSETYETSDLPMYKIFGGFSVGKTQVYFICHIVDLGVEVSPLNFLTDTINLNL